MTRWLSVGFALLISSGWSTLAWGEFSQPGDTNGQATGRPEMRDPHGFDKDRDREDTGDQGRPIDKPVKPVYLQTTSIAVQVAPSYGGKGTMIVPDMRPWWDFLEDSRVAGFHVYVQEPGETKFHLLQSFPLPPADGWQWLDDQTSIPNLMHRFTNHVTYPKLANQIQLEFFDRRPVADWKPGLYRYSVAAFDANGREGLVNSTIGEAAFLPMKILSPEDGAVLTSKPVVFQWTGVSAEMLAAAIDGAKQAHIYTPGWQLLSLYDSAAPSNSTLWNKELPLSATGVVYDGPPLVPGRDYYLMLNAYINSTEHGKAGGVVRKRTTFTVNGAAFQPPVPAPTAQESSRSAGAAVQPEPAPVVATSRRAPVVSTPAPAAAVRRSATPVTSVPATITPRRR